MNETDGSELARIIKEVVVANVASIDVTLIEGDSDLVMLGMDSMDLTTVALELEDRFAIRIDDARLSATRTLNDLVKVVEEQVTQ